MLIIKDICLAIVLIVLFTEEHSDSWDINFGIRPVELSLFDSSVDNYYYCVYLGDQLIVNFSVQGGIATTWQGSAFDQQCSITLRHTTFNNQQRPAAGECNGGTIVAYSIREFSNTYVSQLNVTVIEDMNNKTIECVADHANRTSNVTVQNTLIVVDAITTGSESSAHGNIRLIAVDSNYQRSEDSAHDMHTCSSYFLYSNPCGKCLNITTFTSASCEKIRQNKDLVSTFLVQNEVCDKNGTIEVLLSVPNPPNFKTSAQYDDVGNLISILTSFVYNVSEILNDTSDISINSSPISFTIIYSDSITGVICHSHIVLAISCGWTEFQLCTHVFNVSISSCPPSTDMNVSIFSTNILGNGPTSEYVTIDARIHDGLHGGTDQGSTGKTSDSTIVVVIIIALLIALAIILSTVLIAIRQSKKSCIWKQSHTRDIDLATTESERSAVYSASL